MIQPRRAQGGLVGLAVGDALGVATERKPQEPPAEKQSATAWAAGILSRSNGTWSGETSLAFCTVDALLGEYSLARLGQLFARWLQEGHWASGDGGSRCREMTNEAINRIVRGMPPEHSGSEDVEKDSCGAVIRILPVAIAFSRWSIPGMLEKVYEASSVTHSHARCLMACGLYSLILRNLAYSRSVPSAYRNAMEDAKRFYEKEPWRSERRSFRRIMRGTIGEVQKSQISCEDDCVSVLEAAVWCLQTTRSFCDCLRCAVALDDNRDVIAAVAGGMAGVAYGFDSIPTEWVELLAMKDDLLRISKRFSDIVSA